ncbi:MAG: hypothetical protein APF84_00725 [Gracilibacter sp. BRH_c7a]|nr:MAG: hypothetical protein APF84_00725 [Gracilibacter sp. BRH_c7a]
MRKICVVLLVVLFITGCSIQHESFKEDPQVEDSTIESQDNTNETDSSAIFPKVMFLKGNDIIRFFPDDKSDSIKEIKNTYVTVYNVINNAEREEWAIVEYIDEVNQKHHGYVMSERLSDRPNIPQYVCNQEAISDIAIGDGLEKAIIQYGDDYEVYKSEFGINYAFNKKNRDVITQIDPMSFTVKAIIVNSSGYKTKENFQVGHNAIKVIESYKSKYEMNTDQQLFNDRPESTFDIGDGYVIEFNYEPKELGEESIITSISLYNITDGDW